uniref:Uncharacterized protein n=1 Tax=Anguilla anguilla TaxID=7936 RepID=A0A0E9URE8_ANGAN
MAYKIPHPAGTPQKHYVTAVTGHQQPICLFKEGLRMTDNGSKR